LAESTLFSGDDTTPHVIRCAECHELVPADRVRHREERVKVAAGPRPGRWRSGGPPIFRTNNAPRNLPSRPLGPPTAQPTPGSYALERVPVCVDCLRRQRMGLYGVCGIAAACLLGAIVLYSHQEAPPSSREVALETHSPSPPAAPEPAASAPPVEEPVGPPPIWAAQPPADAPAPAPPSAPAVAAASPAPASPIADSPAAAAEAAPSAPPVWQTGLPRKTAKAAPAPPQRASPTAASALTLRNNGYAALAQRRYGEALTMLQRATMMGDAYAPMYIGQLFESGVGVPRDVGQASYWYGIAINRGNAVALAAFNRLRMNPY
jgi:hypothetical protein